MAGQGLENNISMVFLIGIGIVLAIISWGMLWHNSSILSETLYRGERSKKQVALTFDDGPDPVFTHQVLDILRLYNAKATFFCVGRLAEMYPDIVKRIHMEGHLIANHTYEHSWPIYFWTPSRVRSSINKTGYILEGITGVFPKFYRPPVVKKETHGAALDECLPELIKGLQSRGYELASLDKLFGLPGSLNTPVDAVDAMGIVPPAHFRGLLKSLFQAMLHEHVSPLKLSLALLTGIIIGCSPFFGLHAIIGVITAAGLRLNKLINIGGTNT